MKIQRSIYLKFDQISTGSGVLTLVSPEGEELDSETVEFTGSTYNTLGLAAKNFISRAEHMYG